MKLIWYLPLEVQVVICTVPIFSDSMIIYMLLCTLVHIVNLCWIDGGRNLWEGVWHAWITRFQNKKFPVVGYDTPTHSQPGMYLEVTATLFVCAMFFH